MKKNHKSGQKVLNTRKDIASESPGSRAVIDDITERRRMEAEMEEAVRALRKSEERYRALVMASPDAIYVHVDGFVTLANPAMARLLGADEPSQLLGKSVFEIVDPEFHKIIRGRWRQISDGGSVPLLEEKFVRFDGSTIDVEVTAVALPLSEPREIQVIARDITERKRDEGLLRASSKRLTLALDSAKAGAWDWDVITGHLEWSPQMFDLFGLDRQTADASFESWRTRLHPEDLEPAERRIDEALKRQTILNSDYRLVLPDGGIRWINAVGEGVYDDQGRPVQMIGICQDITERKQAELQREAALEEVARFTYAVSHDLRSPLVTVKTFLGHLEDDLRNRNQERVGEDLGFIKIAADKMGLLLDELLRLSKVGRIINPAEEISLQRVVKDALDVTAGRIAQGGVRIEVTDEPVFLYGDRARLVEIFQNLVDNAAKFMGGQPEPRVEIGVESVDRETVLFVRDNGIGLDPEFEPRLFGMFEKLDAATDGVGLGLALVRRIVELHGGRIWAESKGPGRGATFRFTLAKTRRASGTKDQS